MSNKWMRRCLAASALATASTIATGSAWAESFIQVTVEHPRDMAPDSSTFGQELPAEQYTGFIFGDDADGNGVGSGIRVEWWQWNSDDERHVLNTGCTFSIGVNDEGAVHIPDDVVVSPYTSGGQQLYRMRLSSDCNPSNVNKEESYLKISPLSDSTLDSNTGVPVYVTSITVDSGSNKKRVNNFDLAREGDRGNGEEVWSISDACFVEGLSKNYDPNRVKDYDQRYVHALNVNVNPVLDEGADGADLSSPSGGVMIFPNRSRTLQGTKYYQTICDSGYSPATGRRYPTNLDLSFSLARTTLIDALPHTQGNTSNLDGMGAKRANFRGGDHEAPLLDANVLSVLTYNVASIPKTPDGNDRLSCWLADIPDWLGAGEISKTCNSRVGKRTKRLDEIAESVRTLHPDVVVFAEVFQNHFSGNGIDRWSSSSARDSFKNALNDLYDFKSVGPADQRSNLWANPIRCPNGDDKELTVDQEIYPDQSGDDMQYARYCENPPGNALDSGVLIGVLKTTLGDTHIDVLGEGFDTYGAAEGNDMGAAKGVKYVKIKKTNDDTSEERTYHIFGTHLQSSNAKCAGRIAQIRSLTRFIRQRVAGSDTSDVSANASVIITGDLNIDPILNNHTRKGDNIGNTCRDELEYFVQKLRSVTEEVTDASDNVLVNAGRVHVSPFSMPFSNDCWLNRDVVQNVDSENCGTAEVPGYKSKLLDHVLWMGAKPSRAGSVFYRQVADGDNNNLNAGHELSGHYPMLTTLDYRSDPDEHLWPHYEYGDSKHGSEYSAWEPSRDYDRPVPCPYGTPVEYWPGGGEPDSFDNIEPDLVCLPFKCYRNFSTANDNICNPATHAGPGASRKPCRGILGNEKNFGAPCVIPAGYLNLAQTAAAVVDASSTLQSGTPDYYGPENAVDTAVTLRGDSGRVRYKAWVAASDTPGEDGDWLRVTLPKPQYVKRVRFRPYGTSTTVSPKMTYSLYYEDTAERYAGCDDEASDAPTISGLYCPQVFGDADGKSTPYYFHDEPGKYYADPDLWTVHELGIPVLTDQIIFHCEELDNSDNKCGLAEIEVYGGAE